jgi:hypothetical protein
MDNAANFTAFAGARLLAGGSALEVALVAKAAMKQAGHETILIFDDRTGREIDFDLRGDDTEIAARLQPAGAGPDEARKTSGRPKLGVVSREVTLLPRHWDWLAEQPGGASVTLRKLVETARKTGAASARQAQQAADCFMGAMLGNQPGYEDAARALYAGDRPRFLELSAPWPADLRDHARRLAGPAFPDDGAGKAPAP